MAVERSQEFTIDLSGLVNQRLTNFQTMVTNIRAKQDADFSAQVLNQGLTYSQQLDYFQSRLDSENAKDYPDSSYISTLQGNVASLKKLVRYQKFQDQYTSDFNLYSTGKGSIDTLINEVQSMLSTTTDQSERDNLQKTLGELNTQKFNDTQTILKNNIVLATNDQSIPVLNTMLQTLQSSQAAATASGNDVLASSYGVQIQGLKSSIATVGVTQKTNSMNMEVLTSNTNSIGKLGLLSNLVSSSDANTPVNINGTLFPSLRAYWEFQQNSYISGSGQGVFKDFLGDLKSELNTKAANLSVASLNGAISTPDLMNIKNVFDTLSKQTNMQPYINQLNGLMTDVMSGVATINANAILSEAGLNAGDSKAYNIALQNLTNLQTITGVNQAANITALQSATAASTKTAIAELGSTSGQQTVFNANQISQLKGMGYSDVDINAMQMGQKAVPSNINQGDIPPVDSSVAGKTTPPASTTTPPASTTTPPVPSTPPAKITPPVTTTQPANTTTAPAKSSPAPAPTPAPNIFNNPNPYNQPAPVSSPAQRSYKIAKGDTFWALAPKLGTTVANLQKLNPVDPTKLQIGQTIYY